MGGELIREQKHQETNINNIKEKRKVYSGFEYIEDGFIVRYVDANLVDNFEEFVIELNKFSIIDHFILPATFRELSNEEIADLASSKYLEVKFRSAQINKFLKVLNNKIEKADLDQFVQIIVHYLIGVEKGLYPPIGFYSLEDVFFYAGLFFFLPPQVLSNKGLTHLLNHNSNKYFFYAPEFLKDNVRDLNSTLYVVGKIVEFLFCNTKLEEDEKRYKDYSALIKCLTAEKPSERKLPKEIVNNILRSKLVNIEELYEISEKILQEVKKDERKFITVQVPLDYRSFNLLMQFLYEKIKSNFQISDSPFIYIGNDFANIPREILSKYKEILESEENKVLLQALYSSVKFNTILPILLSFVEKVENLFLVVNDTIDTHYFIRTYLSYIKANNYETKVVIFTRKLYNDETKLDLSELFEMKYFSYVNLDDKTKQSEIVKSLSYQEKSLAILGQKFTHKELLHLEKILGTEIESCLKVLINKNVVLFEGNEYVIEKNLWRDIYETLPEEKKEIHLKLAERLEKMSDPFDEHISKAAFHYEMAGRDLYAAVLYIKFVRWNLDTYVFSTEKMKEILKSAYQILKRRNRLNSFAWNDTIIKFGYQSLEKISEYTYKDLLSNFSDFDKGNVPHRLKTLLSLYAYFIDEEYSKVIELYERVFTGVLSSSSASSNSDFSSLYVKDFLWLQAYLIYQRAYYSLNDTLKELDIFKMIANNIPEQNKNWAKLKAEYMLLYGTAMNYKRPKEAKKYLDFSKKIILELRIRHLEVSLENAYGILNDSSGISISHFKKAIQIACEIGYIKRSMVPTTNLVRSLLYFGFFDELKREIKKFEYIVDTLDNVSDIAYFYRILSFVPMYEGKYNEVLSLVSQSLELERKYKLQESSLRTIVLNELMNGSLEKAKSLINDNLENPALKTRAFEYLLNLVLNYDNDEKFKKGWLNYRNSHYNLLREEILYIFAEKIAHVDESGFLSEVRRWESFYTLGNVNLSLLYVLLAKYKYFNYKKLWIKCATVENEICKLINFMGDFSHPLVETCSGRLKKHLKRQEQRILELEEHLEELLHVFKRLDSNISIEQFVEFFSNQIYRIFKPDKFLIYITDRVTNLEYEISNTNELPDSELFTLQPFEIFVKEYIDNNAYYKLYISSEQFQLPDTSKSSTLSTITLIEELFSGQIKGLISRERANIDNLTGLYNRWRFNYLLNQKIEDKSKVFSVFIMDIDDFKKVNDTYGHAVGDKVLKVIAHLIKKFVVFESEGNTENIVARYGGEEFIGIVNGSKLEAYKICENLRKYLEIESINLFGFRVSVSVGIAESTEKENLTELVGLADQRLYAVKNSGKNRVEIE